MSAGGGGRGGRDFFLSSHRCPEADLLPRRNSETQIPMSCSKVPAEKHSEITCTGQSDANYLDVSSSCHSGEEEQEVEEEEEGSISEWSEEDLSLHFSPSVILPSDDEDSDPESGFECVDITMETQVNGHEGEVLKMVPKRQIQLKKKKDTEKDETEKLQVILKDGPAEGKAPNSEVSTNEQSRPVVCHRPDLLLRQHSMPAALHTHSTTNNDNDIDSNRVYKGLVAGASQGFPNGANSRQRLQKSISLDETKTKMASCIIKSVLSKKMQAEQSNSKTAYLQKKSAVSTGPPQPADQQRVKEGRGGKTGGGVSKAPVHVVRDMRSLVKNNHSFSLSTAATTATTTTTTGNNNKSKASTTTSANKPTSFKVIGQEESPPPTYQQAVGVKSHEETKKSCQASVYSTKVAATLSQQQEKKHSNIFSRPMTQERRGSEPIINRSKVDDVTWPVELLDLPTKSPASKDLPEISQAKRGSVSHQAGTSLPPSGLNQPTPRPPSTPRHPKGTQSLLSAQEQSSILGVSSQFAPSSSQQILHPCFYTPSALPAFPPTMHPHVGKVSYLHTPLSYIPSQLQPPPPASTLHLLRRSEENQSKSAGHTPEEPNHFIKTYPSNQIRTTVDQENKGNTVTPAIQEQPEQQNHQQQLQQQQFLCSVPGFLPAQVGNDFLMDITGSTAAPGALLSGPGPCQVMLDPKSGQCFYVDTPPQPQRKMLLDPETGQYVQVFLPPASSTPNNGMFPVRCANPTPFAPSMINPTPTVLSVMQFQPTVAMSPMYATPCLPFTLHTPSVNFTHPAP